MEEEVEQREVDRSKMEQEEERCDGMGKRGVIDATVTFLRQSSRLLITTVKQMKQI